MPRASSSALPQSARRIFSELVAARRLPVIAAADMARKGDRIRSCRQQGSRRFSNSSPSGRGCKMIACITGPAENSTAQDRAVGCSRAIADAGLQGGPDFIIYSNYMEDGGYRAMQRILALNPRPDGLFVTNNRMAVGVLRALQEQAVAIPNQMNVIGFDELPWSLELHPHMSLVRQLAYSIGQEARELIDCANEKSPLVTSSWRRNS